MRSSLKLVTIKNISVYLHFTLLFYVVWLVLVAILSSPGWEQLFWSVMVLASVFVCIAFHEYGHAFVAAQFGINASRITLYPIGGIASIEKLPDSARQELLISSAGPLVSFVLAAVFLLLAPQKFMGENITETFAMPNEGNFFYVLGLINFFIALFNLIPAFPMDGGRILRAFLSMRFNYLKATSLAASTGRVTAIILCIIGLISFNFLLCVISVFIILFGNAEESYLQVRSLIGNLRLKDVLMFDYNSINAEITLKEAANILENNHSRYFIVTYEGQPIGTLNRMKVIEALADQDYEKKVGTLVNDQPERLEGATFIADMLDKFAVHDEQIYPVFEKDRFIGMINFQQIMEYLLLHSVSAENYPKVKSLARLV